MTAFPAPAPVRLGFVPASRGFFSQELAARMRAETLAALQTLGLEVVVPTPEQTRNGCVGTRAEAVLCARMFREREVQGLVVGAVNFGDEQAVAAVWQEARLNVPVLIFGCQEEAALHPGLSRRDAFCGLLSIGEALRQVRARYSIGRCPIGFPREAELQADLRWFAGVCRVVGGLRRARYGQIGARPDAFWTCRFDERALQGLGPTTVTLDLSEVLAGVRALPDTAPELAPLISAMTVEADTTAVAPASLVKMAKLELFLTRWGAANGIDAFAIQCWTSIQQNLGVCACNTMSRLMDRGVPAACEADVLGAMAMHACQLASGQPAALADWNNLHNDDPELVNLWHCGVFPKRLAQARPRLASHPILVGSGAVPPANGDGIVELVLRPGPVTLARVTQPADGGWRALVTQGAVEDNAAATGGSYGWCRIPGLPRLYRQVLLRHFPHHVAMTPGRVGNILYEAFGNYFGLAVHYGDQAAPGVYAGELPFPDDERL